MDKKYVHLQFWKYVLPSMFSMLLCGFYSIVDGLFVGNSVGDVALAAINIAYPIQVILNASAIGIGIGGSVLMAGYHGQNDLEKGKHALGSTFTLLLSIGLLLPCVLLFFVDGLLAALGAEGVVFVQAKEYIVMILLGGLLPVLGNGLNPLIRNYGKTIVATLIMSSGLITNIILDYVFVFEWRWGLGGAGLATIIAQGVVAFGSLVYLCCMEIRHYRLYDLFPKAYIVRQIVRIGISPFGQTLMPSFVLILTNWMCLKYGGSSAVTIYSVVSYVLASAQLLLQGVGDGVQPLLSYYQGAGLKEEVQELYHKAFYMSLIVALFLCLGVVYFQVPLTNLFGVSEQLVDATRSAILITAISFPFLGIVRCTSAYFYASGQAKSSSLLVYLEPCLILPSILLLFSFLFHLNGIWLTYPTAQIILCGIALLLKRPHRLPQLRLARLKMER